MWEEVTPLPWHIDSQSVKAPQAKERGIDGNKKVKLCESPSKAGGLPILIIDRKRHVAVDSDGRLLLVNLTPANIADWAHRRLQLMNKEKFLDFIVEIVKRYPLQKGFAPLPNRWVVERTFGWMMRWRRLVRDYEERLDVSEAMIQIAMASQLLRRIVSIMLNAL